MPICDDHVGGTSDSSAYMYVLNCDSDGDGVLDENGVRQGTVAGTPVDSTGRPLRDCNNDCLFNGADISCIVTELLGP